MTNKEKYRLFCKDQKTLPIFFQDWWLDAVCEQDHWDVTLVEKGGEIVASLPYFKTKKLWYTFFIKPKLTPYLGPWIKYPSNQKTATKLKFEKSVITDLIKNLPSFDLFYQDFHYSYINWLPFYWKNFKQTTIYSYILKDLSNLENVFEGFRNEAKREISKAQKTITIHEEDSIEKLYELNEATYKRQRMDIPFSLNFLKRVDEACKTHQCRKLFIAKDDKDQVHSALYLIWDDQSAYYLMGGSDPQLRTSGAASLLIWEAIQFASKVTQQFDFEGGLIEPVEKFFRSFGAEQMPYHRVSKVNSLFLKIIKFILAETNLERNFRLKAK